MRKYFYYFLFLFVLFWCEIAFSKVFPGSYFVPQFVLLFVVVFAVGRDFQETLVMSMLGGFLGELFSGLYFGTVISSMLAASLIAYFVSRNITAQAISLSNAAVLVVSITAILPLWAFLYNLIIFGLGLADTPVFQGFYSWGLLWRVLANFLVFFPVNRLFKILFYE